VEKACGRGCEAADGWRGHGDIVTLPQEPVDW
jgi:hypothetical protein